MNSKAININDVEIGGSSAFIIADIGSNHKQDLSLAKESIDAAAEAGANAIKFQSIQLKELYYKPNIKTASFVKKLEFPEEWHFTLNEYCKKRDIVFFSSPTYLKSVDLLEKINVPLYKLASAQIGTFPQIVEKVARLNKPTIFSTGISTYSEIIKAVEIFKKYNNNKFIILHCNSIYPTPPERVNLDLMLTYRQMFGNPVGFSDHTIGTHIATAAVVLGANVIEKHFTLSRTLDTPDSNDFACDPEEFKQLVSQIRAVEAAKKSDSDRLNIQTEELNFKNSILYKVVSKRGIKAGEKVNKDDFNFLRTKEGIDCRDFISYPDLFVVTKDIRAGELMNKIDFRFQKQKS